MAETRRERTRTRAGLRATPVPPVQLEARGSLILARSTMAFAITALFMQIQTMSLV